MLRKALFKDIGITRKNSFTVLVLLFNSFTWWYNTLVFLYSVAQNDLVIWSAYYISLIASGFVSSALSYKIRRLNILRFWMLLGAISSLLPILIGNTTMNHIIAISILLGVSFGWGIPSCLSYFAEITLVENRGRLGGVTYSAISLSLPIFAFLSTTSDLTTNSIIFAIWRTIGLMVFYFLKPKEKILEGTRKSHGFVSIFHNRSFILYIIPWTMFCLVNRLEAPILRTFFGPDFFGLMILTEYVLGGVFALIGGVLSDFIGRKRMITYGFITMGLAYAFLGIATTTIISWYIYLIIDGITWGIFLAIFVLILWGDLSEAGVREKYYLLGSIPFFLTDLLQLLLDPYVALIPAYAAFSLASFFLFLAVLPLMYAPETLPEKKMEIRRLKGYIEQAKKFTQKYTKKSGNKS